MSKRIDALWRIWAFLWISTVGYVIGIVVGVIALVWAIVDLLWQLIVGTDGLSSSSSPAMAVSGTFKWLYGQNLYFLTGGGSGGWQALPKVM